MEIIDTYVNCIRQVAALLGYQEPQIEVFKNTLPTKLYWVLFPIMDLKQAVEMAKRILTKEKIQTIGRKDFLNSIHEHRGWFKQKGNLQHDRWYGTETDSHDG